MSGPIVESVSEKSAQAKSIIGTREDELERAYQTGKKDASLSFQSDLAKVASNVYDHIQDQLNGIQVEQVNASKSMVIFTYFSWW